MAELYMVGDPFAVDTLSGSGSSGRLHGCPGDTIRLITNAAFQTKTQSSSHSRMALLSCLKSTTAEFVQTYRI